MPLPSSPMMTALSPSFSAQVKSCRMMRKSFLWVKVKFFICNILGLLSFVRCSALCGLLIKAWTFACGAGIQSALRGSLCPVVSGGRCRKWVRCSRRGTLFGEPGEIPAGFQPDFDENLSRFRAESGGVQFRHCGENPRKSRHRKKASKTRR